MTNNSKKNNRQDISKKISKLKKLGLISKSINEKLPSDYARRRVKQLAGVLSGELIPVKSKASKISSITGEQSVKRQATRQRVAASSGDRIGDFILIPNFKGRGFIARKRTKGETLEITVSQSQKMKNGKTIRKEIISGPFAGYPSQAPGYRAFEKRVGKKIGRYRMEVVYTWLDPMGVPRYHRKWHIDISEADDYYKEMIMGNGPSGGSGGSTTTVDRITAIG